MNSGNSSPPPDGPSDELSPDGASGAGTAALRVQGALRRGLARLGFSGDWFLIPLAAVTGVLAGLTAIGFDMMVEWSDQRLFERLADDRLAPSWLRIALLPMLGALAVGLIQRYLARKPAGHGIPDVIESLARRGGKMKLREGIYTAVNSSLTIGSGGSAGVEGPIVQIGSVLGSVVGQVLRVGHKHMNMLVGCGAAAGLASIFNAPIAGVLFVLEVMLRDFSLKTFMPIVIAAVFGVATSQAVLGHNQAMFSVPATIQQYEFAFREIAPYAMLGALCGVLGFAFTRSLHTSEYLWQRSRLPAALRPAMGGLLLGVTGLLMMLAFGEVVQGYDAPPFFGNGYPVIETCFDPMSYAAHGPVVATTSLTVLFLLVTCGCKLIGTSLTLGSGGVGGIFAPSLFMGATLGGAFGLVVAHVPGFAHAAPATYALAGMAGVLAGCVHCPLTAFLMVFEITQDYKLILPVMLVAMLATTISQVLQGDSIYSAALRERGIRMGLMSDLTVLRRLYVSQVPLEAVVAVHPEEPAQRLLDLAHLQSTADFVVTDGAGVYLGLVVGEDLRTTLLQQEAVPLMIVDDVMRTDLPTVTRDDTLEAVLDRFARHDVSSLAAVDADMRVLGLVTRTAMIRHYQQVLNSPA